MKIPKHSLRKIVTFLNNPDEDGGFWLPNIQRPFVWSEEKTCRLFDSILREYPISTLLVWKTKSTIRRRKFIDNFLPQHRHQLTAFYVPEDDKKKCLVLDGQQRLQSLYIGLKGSYEGRELFLDILSGEVAAPDDVKFKFAFLEPDKGRFPWIKFKYLVFSKQDMLTEAQGLMKNAGRTLDDSEKQKISKHVALVFKAFHSDDGIAYQELDSIENEDLYTEDDVVEVFIRANSGGTPLGKSDLLFSLLTSTWDNADDQMESLLEKLNRHGLASNRVDFVLTDPPYLANYVSRDGRKVANDSASDWLKPAFHEIYRVLRWNRFCVSFYGWHKSDRFLAAWREVGFRIVGHLTFIKGYASTERFLRYQHENAYLLAKGNPKKPTRTIPDVLEWKYTGNTFHPTQKPVSVLTPLVESFSNPGDVVLDPFCGSGSTLLAARNVNRRFLGIELSKQYFDLAEQRLR